MEMSEQMMEDSQPTMDSQPMMRSSELIPEAEFTSAKVEQAVLAMYHYQGGGPLPQAEVFLLQAQASLSAWTFSWELLHPAKAQEVQFFGAKSLHTKVCANWHDLEGEECNKMQKLLRDKLLQYQNTSDFVVAKLLQVVAATAIQQKVASKDARNPVQCVMSLFDTQENPQNHHVYLKVLDILGLLPEQCKKLNLGKMASMNINSALQAAVPEVLAWLSGVLTMDPGLVDMCWTHALDCVHNWLDLRPEAGDLLVVMEKVFGALRSPGRLEPAVDLITKVFGCGSLQRHSQTLCRLFQLLNGLRPWAESCLQTFDMDTVNSVCFIMADAAENNSSQLAAMLVKGGSERDTAVALLETIMVVGFPPGQFLVHEDISPTTLTFWASLLEDSKVSRRSSEASGVEMRQLMGVVYRHLGDVLLGKMQYPDDHWLTQCDPEELEEFQKYRQEIGETMVCCYAVLQETMVDSLYQALLATVNKMEEGSNFIWQEQEAILMTYVSIGAECGQQGSSLHDLAVYLLPKLPPPAVNHLFFSTALALIERFYSRLREDSLDSMLPLVLQGLQHSQTASGAVKVLDRFTTCLPRNIRLLTTPEVFSAVKGVVERGEEGQQEDCAQLMRCLGRVMRWMTPGELESVFEGMVTPRLLVLQQLMTPPGPLDSQGMKSVERRVVHQTRLVSCLLDGLDVIVVFQTKDQLPAISPGLVSKVLQIFPLVKEIVEKWKTTPTVISAVCELLMNSVTLAQTDYRPMADHLAAMVVDMYETMPHEAILKLVEVIVLEFEEDCSLWEGVALLINALVNKIARSFEKLLDDPEVLEAFHKFIYQLLAESETMQGSPGINIEEILHIGVNCIKHPMVWVARHADSVVNAFLSISEENERYQATVNNNMQLIVNTVMEGICSETDECVLFKMSDVLRGCCRYQLQSCTAALRHFLSQAPPSCKATDQDRAYFVKFLISNTRSTVKCQELVKDFSRKSRGTTSS